MSTSSRLYTPVPYWSWEGTPLLGSLPYPYPYTVLSKFVHGTLWDTRAVWILNPMALCNFSKV